jgi:hypothetical protein
MLVSWATIVSLSKYINDHHLFLGVPSVYFEFRLNFGLKPLELACQVLSIVLSRVLFRRMSRQLAE